MVSLLVFRLTRIKGEEEAAFCQNSLIEISWSFTALSEVFQPCFTSDGIK
jgi:hypothetical protein